MSYKFPPSCQILRAVKFSSQLQSQELDSGLVKFSGQLQKKEVPYRTSYVDRGRVAYGRT